MIPQTLCPYMVILHAFPVSSLADQALEVAGNEHMKEGRSERPCSPVSSGLGGLLMLIETAAERKPTTSSQSWSSMHKIKAVTKEKSNLMRFILPTT